VKEEDEDEGIIPDVIENPPASSLGPS